jgi:hypothetical protein
MAAPAVVRKAFDPPRAAQVIDESGQARGEVPVVEAAEPDVQVALLADAPAVVPQVGAEVELGTLVLDAAPVDGRFVEGELDLARDDDRRR